MRPERGEVQNNNNIKKASGVLRVEQKINLRTFLCAQIGDVAIQFIWLKLTWELFEPPVNLPECSLLRSDRTEKVSLPFSDVLCCAHLHSTVSVV